VKLAKWWCKSKMFICKTSKSDVDKKTIKNGKWILSRILLNFCNAMK
jgi:hypothetical protein